MSVYHLHWSFKKKDWLLGSILTKKELKYVVDNIHEVANEITKKYGLTPEIHTIEVTEINDGQYEIVQISSLGGACWVVNRLDEIDTPRYFTSRQELEKFKQGWFN